MICILFVLLYYPFCRVFRFFRGLDIHWFILVYFFSCFGKYVSHFLADAFLLNFLLFCSTLSNLFLECTWRKLFCQCERKQEKLKRTNYFSYRNILVTKGWLGGRKVLSSICNFKNII